MEEIVAGLNKQIEGIDLTTEQILNVVPKGWHFFVAPITRLQQITDLKITKVLVEKGLLRIHGSCSLEVDQLLFDRVSQSIAKDSAVSCMVCGKRGFRRRDEMWWPSFCGTHYIEYVNFMDNQE